MHILLGVSLLLIQIGIVSARAVAQEASGFECVASIGPLHYLVQLSHGVLGHRMRVSTEAGLVADGPASSYREGTRFFTPTGPGRGLKLTVDQDPARICFGAGGSDCHACEPSPVLTRAYDDTLVCASDGFTLEAHRVYGSYSDIVVKDGAGKVIASGQGVESGRHATTLALLIGPGEVYQATYSWYEDSLSCTTMAPPATSPSPPPSPQTDATCEVFIEGAGPVSFSLLREGRVRFAKYYYDRYSYMIGPVSEIEHGRWLLSSAAGDVTYRQFDGNSGVICQGECVACTVLASTEAAARSAANTPVER